MAGMARWGNRLKYGYGGPITPPAVDPEDLLPNETLRISGKFVLIAGYYVVMK